jgi:hypothetical protein
MSRDEQDARREGCCRNRTQILSAIRGGLPVPPLEELIAKSRNGNRIGSRDLAKIAELYTTDGNVEKTKTALRILLAERNIKVE